VDSFMPDPYTFCQRTQVILSEPSEPSGLWMEEATEGESYKELQSTG
jgi:hypothetical protein